MGQQITGFESDPPGTIFSKHTKKEANRKDLYCYTYTYRCSSLDMRSRERVRLAWR